MGPTMPYQNFAPQFKAELFDPDHWAEVFQRSGAKYVVLTSKHHEGFALWPSKEASATWGRPWNAVEIGPHRDLLGDLTDAVRRKGLRMGIYYSLYEWYNPLWLYDKPRYVREHMFPQFKDVVTRYKPSFIFSDGEWELPSADWHSPELLAWLFNESPVKDEVVINDRWGGDTRHKHGGYWTTEYTAGMSGIDHPWEENRGMGVSYGYNRAEDLQDLSHRARTGDHSGGHRQPRRQPAAGYRAQRRRHHPSDYGGAAQADWRLDEASTAKPSTAPSPWKTTRQWSAGEVPKVEYNQEFSAPYDVTKLTEKPEPGKAGIEAFFTTKGSDVYAILPHWSGSSSHAEGRDRGEVGKPAGLDHAAEVQSFESGSIGYASRSPRTIAAATSVGVEDQPVDDVGRAPSPYTGLYFLCPHMQCRFEKLIHHVNHGLFGVIGRAGPDCVEDLHVPFQIRSPRTSVHASGERVH